MSLPKKVRPNLEKRQAKSQEDKERLLQDLQVHQAELEAQNLELRRLRLEQEKLARELSVLYDFAPVGYLSLDSKSRILRSNLTFSSLIGKERKHLQGEPLFLFVKREDRDILFLHLRRLFKGRGRARCELRLNSVRGKILPVQIESIFELVSDDKMVALTSVTDISEIVRARQELKRSEEEFRNLAEHAPDIIARFDKDCRHLYVNVRAEEVLGIPRKNIVGKTNRELGYPESLVEFWQNKIGEVFSTKGKLSIEYALPTTAGEKHLESSLVPELDFNGNVVSVLGLTRDITHFKEAEQRIRHLNDRLEKQAQDLRQINQELESFTYAVSHDLRAPLRSIKGFAEALEEDFSSGWPDEAKDYLRRVARAADKMTNLIDSLLILSRVTREEILVERVDLSLIVRDFAKELQRSLPDRKTEFVIRNGIKVRGDPRLLEIAVQNLLRNAWKFTKHRSPARIEFGMEEEKNRKVFFIKDDGVGFDMSYAGKLFVPFQRLHSSSDFPGAGIGLATVQRIIRLHKGRVWAEGQEGEGATFYFTTGASEG